MNFFTSYEKLPLEHQQQNICESIKKIYIECLDSQVTQTPSAIKSQEELYERFQQQIEQKSQKANDLLQIFRQAVQQKSFILAHALYEQLQTRGFLENQLKFTTLNNCIIAKFNQQDLVRVIESFNIDIKTLRTDMPLENGISASMTTTSVIIPYIQELWQTDIDKAKPLWHYFIAQGLPCQAETSYNHALIISMCSTTINLNFIKVLLESNVVDINTVITSKTDSTCKVVKTPFSVAVGKANFELLSLLLEYGADPYLAINIARSIVELQDKPEIKLVVSSGLAGNLPVEQDQEEYLNKLDEFIENFFLAKLGTQENIAQARQVSSSIKPQSEKEISNDDGATSLQKDNTSVADFTPTEKVLVLDQYIKYKQDAQHNPKLAARKILEHKFDALLLQWIQNNDARYLETLNALLEENPQLNTYYGTCLLDRHVPTALVNEAFAAKPELLHKFYTLKKKLNGSTEKGTESLTLQKEIYKVQGHFTNKIFIKIPQKTIEELDVLDPIYKAKVLNQLPTLQFIKADSKGISGIKSYSGCYKLKIAQTDKNLYATQRYLDRDGNILIIFDNLADHTHTPYKGSITTTYCDFTKTIYTIETDLDVTNHHNTYQDTNSETLLDSSMFIHTTETTILGGA